MIAHWKLSVSQLSAISSNLGTVNAGTINGITINGGTINGGTIVGGVMDGTVIYAGSGQEVTLDASGVTLHAGQSQQNRLKWTNGAFIEGYGSASGVITHVHGEGSVYLTHGGGVGGVRAYSGGLEPFSSGPALGSPGARWGQIHVDSEYHWQNPGMTSSPDYPVAWSPGNRQMYVRNDGVNDVQVANPTFIHVRGGLVVDVF